jgi:hypothetical protein
MDQPRDISCGANIPEAEAVVVAAEEVVAEAAAEAQPIRPCKPGTKAAVPARSV